ncbi:unnamed protein product [Durusdinium trenchii]|uniref:3-phosphoshikimate 1-carboxyvinyltransferase n=1 Tax=Durusdinium trenchii TaxID=1381693 RepID=A0ABP0PRX0_9DINO
MIHSLADGSLDAGCNGELPKAGTEEAPLELFVANAGTAARFLSAMVCLGKGVYRISGVPRMHERPQKELIEALRKLGYRVDTPNNKLPAVFFGKGPISGSVTVSVEESSQFASALLLSSRAGQWDVSIPAGANPDELPYVEMTRELVKAFPHDGGEFQIEADASSASYFHAVNALFGKIQPVNVLACQPPKSQGGTGWQIDAEFPRLAPLNENMYSARQQIGECWKGTKGMSESRLTLLLWAVLIQCAHLSIKMGQVAHRWRIQQKATTSSAQRVLRATVASRTGFFYFVSRCLLGHENIHDPYIISRKRLGEFEPAPKLEASEASPVSPVAFLTLAELRTHLGDSIMTAITISGLADGPYAFVQLGVLRKQECERVKALHEELKKCNFRVVESGDTLEVLPIRNEAQPGHARIATYHDHRMAMCFATLGLAVPGLKIEDPSCVRKTVPSFFQILAAPPPNGLGVEIWECDPKSGERLRRLQDPKDLEPRK